MNLSATQWRRWTFFHSKAPLQSFGTLLTAMFVMAMVVPVVCMVPCDFNVHRSFLSMSFHAFFHVVCLPHVGFPAGRCDFVDGYDFSGRHGGCTMSRHTWHYFQFYGTVCVLNYGSPGTFGEPLRISSSV